MRGCPGRCSMHGACLPSGACACFDGWQGTDCAVRCADSNAASNAAGGGRHAAAALAEGTLSEGTVRLSRGNPYAVHGAGRSLLAQQLEEAPAHAPAHGGGLEQPGMRGIARPLLEELLDHPLTT